MSEFHFLIAAGADHAGFALKQELVEWLRSVGHQILDLGVDREERCDYPVFAEAVARAVTDGRARFGLLVCGTGQGMAMTANRMPGIRAAVVLDTFSARASRAHNDANILCLGSRVCGPGLAREIASAWLETPFEGGRHGERVALMHRFDTKSI